MEDTQEEKLVLLPSDEILVLSDSIDRLTEAIRDLNGLVRDSREWKHVVPSNLGTGQDERT